MAFIIYCMPAPFIGYPQGFMQFSTSAICNPRRKRRRPW